MGKSGKRNGSKESAAALVWAGGKAEMRLLRREQRAEQTLINARARLAKAQTRLERRLSDVADAEALLRSRQEARAAGPNGSPSAPVDERTMLVTATEPGNNGTEATIITGPDVYTELAAIESESAHEAEAPAPQRPSRRRTPAKAVVAEPDPEPADIVVPAAEKAAPRRRTSGTKKPPTKTS